MSRTIPLSRGYVAVVDDEDYEWLSERKWFATQDRKNVSTYAYRTEMRNGRTRYISMHRVILDAPKGMTVDHIDGNGLNNTRANLRLATVAQNTRNMKIKSGYSSRFKGVHWATRPKRWRATIHVGDKIFSLGEYRDEERAALAYDEAARHHFGEFARLNFPEVTEYPCRPKPVRTSKYRGVSRQADRKWRAEIRVNGKHVSLGSFADEIEAAKAYDAAAVKYRGGEAVLNFGASASDHKGDER